MNKTIKIGCVVLMAAIILSALLWYTRPEANKTEPRSVATIVEVAPVERGGYPVTINAMGEVTASLQIDLNTQVGGEIISISSEFAPGGLIQQGETVLQIDPSDYKLEVIKQRALLQQAEAAYEIELGKQANARKELRLLRQNNRQSKDDYLVLRGPQLKQAEADRDRARAELKKAELNLERTTLRVPFNALVVDRKTNLGGRVSAQQVLATLVSTNEYWLQISVPVQLLNWLEIGENGSPVLIYTSDGKHTRDGHVARLLGRLEAGSRLASLIVSVNDPLLLNQQESHQQMPPLLLGDYVAVKVSGKMLNNVYRTQHHHVRNGNILWAARDQKMVFVPVDILYKDREYVYFDALLQPDEKIVTSNISTPVDGMRIQVSDKQAIHDKHSNHSTVSQLKVAPSSSRGKISARINNE